MKAKSDILYIRAAIGPIARKIKSEGGLRPYLNRRVEFSEIFAPHFYSNRFFWQDRKSVRPINSGALGKIVANFDGATISEHPTHAFVGTGDRVKRVLSDHDHNSSSFRPIADLANENDFSMLLLGCVDESPGFSTVHASQFELGLSQKHLLRYALRWDYDDHGNLNSKIPIEYPGCSASFGKFYSYYQEEGILERGNWDGVTWLFISSARHAMEVEKSILTKDPRFIKCTKRFCLTCSLRLY